MNQPSQEEKSSGQSIEPEPAEPINEHDRYVNDMENKVGVKRGIAEIKFYKRQSANARLTRTTGSFIVGLLLLVNLIITPLLLGYFLYTRFSAVYGILGLGFGFFGSLLPILVGGVVWRTANTYAAKKDKNTKEVAGTVIASSWVSTYAVGSHWPYNHSRVLGVAYKVKIQIGDKQVIGYSKNKFYEKNEPIIIRYNPKKPWRCYIVQEPTSPDKTT